MTEGTTEPRYDSAEVKTAARGRELELLEACANIPRESLDGRHCSCPKCGGPNDRARMYDRTTGAFLCNKCGEYPDWIAAVGWMRGCDFTETIRIAAEYLGVRPKEGEAKPATPADILAAVARAKKVKPESLQHFGGVVENGAVVFPTWDAKGNQQLSFRIWPGSGKPAKGMFDSKSKKGNEGKFAGVFLPVVDGKPVPPQPGETVLLFEGVKDPAAALEMGYQAVGLNTCRMNKKFAPLFRGVHLIACPDRDTAGDDGSQQICRVSFRTAASVKIAIWPVEIKPKDGADFRDIRALPDGEQLIREAIESAQEWKPEADHECSWPRKPQIKIGPDEHRMTDEAVAILATRGDMFQRGGALVEIRENPPPPKGVVRPDGGVRAVRIPRAHLRGLLTASAEFVRLKKSEDGDEWVPTHIPQPVVDQVEVRGEWPGMPSLEGVVTSPQFLADGSILNLPGYNAHSGLWFAADCAFPAVPESPTLEDAKVAALQLLEVVQDFPVDDVGKAAWLSIVLTVAARHAIDGPTPLFALDANVRGSGKSKLADAVGQIHTGRDLPRSTFTGDDAETRKMITATLLAGESQVLLDNVGGVLGCPSLDALLTSTTWTDRVLGVSQMTAAIPARAVWMASGNNLQFGADTARRTLRIRLESPLENPEERSGFAHPNLLAWVKRERGRLAAAAVTILRAWHCAKRPDMKLSPWGSFEAWSHLIRNPIAWLGYPDPGSTRQEVQRESDREAMLLRQLLDAWEQADPERHGLFVVDVLAMAEKGNEPAMTNIVAELTGANGKVSARGIGMKLHHLRGRVCGGRYFDKRDARQGALWVVKSAEVGDSQSTPCATSTTCATISNPPACEILETHIHDAHAHTLIGRRAESSGASPASGAVPCDHDPANGIERSNQLFCRGCDKLLGYLEEV